MSKISELCEELDLEFWFDQESRAYKLTRGSSGMQLNAKECPSCGDRRWRTYINRDTGRGNCLAGDTLVLTREFGSIEIKEIAHQNVHLLDGRGDWVRCHIYDHGIQETFETKFEGFRGSVVVRSTAHHGWVKEDGTVIETDKFTTSASSQKIADLRPSKLIHNVDEYAKGVAHGLFYGDGSSDRESAGFRLRLCSHHESLAPWLDRFSKTFPVSAGGDPVYRVFKKQVWCDLKSLPSVPGRSLDYLLGFLRGWFAADGCVSTQPNATLCCDRTEYVWLKQWGPLVGWHTIKATQLASKTNFGLRVKQSLNVGLRTRMMEADDFLIQQHRERWLANPFLKFDRVWRVNKRSHSPRRERVFCPFVPTTNSFALASGVHSRNCFVCNEPFDKAGFIHHALGQPRWKDTLKHIEETLKQQGWRPKKVVSVAVDDTTVKLPLSFPLPTPDGQNLQYLEDRGITAELAGFFKLRFCEEGWWNFVKEDGERGGQRFDMRVIIPVFDLDGTLMTFQGRDITGTSDRKYLFPSGLPGTGRFLLNGHNAMRAKRLVMGEGFMDVASIKKALDEENELRDVGVVGSFGKHLSFGSLDGNDQLGRFVQLRDHGLQEVTIMWDGEKAALISALAAAKLLRGIGLKVKIALLPEGRDPNEVTTDVVRKAFYGAKVYEPKLDVIWRLRNPYAS